MSNSITIQIRGDTAENWTSKNPVPKDRELCYDKTNNKLKTGDGTTAWKSLRYTPEIINALTSTNANAALSAAQGKALADRITTLENKPAGSNVTVTDNLTSTSTTAALSANQGRVLNSKIPTVSTATNSSSTTTAASSSAVKAAYDLAQSAYNKAGSSSSSYSHPTFINCAYGTSSSYSDYYPFSGYGTYLYFKIKYADYVTAIGGKGLDIRIGIASGGDGIGLEKGEYVVTWRVA